MNRQNLSPNKLLEQAALQTVALREQQIQLYVPDVKAIQDAYMRKEISFPYWSKVWPSSIALSEFLLLHPNYILGKRVVELGAGLGLPSLVAARYAASVLCTDHAPEAVQYAQLSATYNKLDNFQSALLDWNHFPEDIEADVVLLSDINYEPMAFDALMKVIKSFLQRGIVILLSTPQRLMAKDFIVPLLAYCTMQHEIPVLQEKSEVMISVMVLGKKSD